MTATRPEIITAPDAIAAAVRDARSRGRRIGFVPTMGALHAGHASLAATAAAECDDVAVSIFVNPTQFGPHEDFHRYPRALEADCRLLAEQQVRWVFAPPVEAIYPPGHATRIVIEGPALPLEGAIRPGHFSGVATVVQRLFQLVPADRAYFGAKDWQQTVVVRRMVADLGIPMEIVVLPTVREADGLAMSSRNAYLSPADRRRAVGLHVALVGAERDWSAGVAPEAIAAGMRRTIEAHGIAVDYATVVDPESLQPLSVPHAGAVALVAGRLGTTRLIDNRLLAADGRPGAAP
jgi:pantoate--beta-alanine ligase